MKNPLVLIKLGGSLITDKTKPLTAKPEIIDRLASEIRRLRDEYPRTGLIIGNGGGSYGHYLVGKYKLQRSGDLAANQAATSAIRQSVGHLNGLVVRALVKAGLPAVAVRDSTFEAKIETAMKLIESAKVACVYGDIVREGKMYKVVSTEEIFGGLVKRLKTGYSPISIVYVAAVDGVLDRDGKIIDRIAPGGAGVTYQRTRGFDVTGGMRQKVESALKLAPEVNSVHIVGGMEPGNILKAIKHDKVGTLVG